MDTINNIISVQSRCISRLADSILLGCVLLVMLVSPGCASTASAGRQYVAPADHRSAIRAVHNALDSMHYATASAGYDKINNYVVSAFDRDGNNVVVTVSSGNASATPILVSVEPGQNDSLRQQIIHVIDGELRR